MPENVIVIIGLAVLAALLLGRAVWWLWWQLPKREVAGLALKIRDARARADVEDNYRKTIGQALGGVVVLLGTGVAYLQFSQQQRASHDLLISNQVSKGFEQLGSEKVVIRLGGIYALEGVMNNSDQYHRPVLEALTAFIREGTRTETALPPTPALPPGALPSDFFYMYAHARPLPTDIQAALTVIGRRSAYVSDEIDLSDANLTRAKLFHADLTLTGLFYTDLHDALLSDVNLTGARLFHADLHDALLSDVNLTGADLTGANLIHVNLIHVNLIHVNLTGADLTGANLTRANLIRANLTRANLVGASLDGQKQLDEACGSNAKLPTGLTLKPCP